MELGIGGRRAILMASNDGLGRACADAIAAEGVDVVVNGRTATTTEAAAAEIAATHGVTATPVVADATTSEGRAALLAACPEPDIVLLNAGGPTPAPFGQIDDAAWEEAADRGMVAPLSFVREVLPGMRERGFGRIVAVTSAMVKSPNSMMALSVAPRLGLTGALKAVSKEAVRDNVTINLLLPERFDTGRQRYMAELAMTIKGISYEEARAEQEATINAGRLGRPEEFGATFAFLCSAHAGFLSGQSLQLDGGSYEGVF